jgi:hypothetical protein
MKKISRKEAELLMKRFSVVSSNIEQDLDELRVRFKLTDRQSCLVTYDLADQSKSYYLESVSI